MRERTGEQHSWYKSQISGQESRCELLEVSQPVLLLSLSWTVGNIYLASWYIWWTFYLRSHHVTESDNELGEVNMNHNLENTFFSMFLLTPVLLARWQNGTHSNFFVRGDSDTLTPDGLLDNLLRNWYLMTKADGILSFQMVACVTHSQQLEWLRGSRRGSFPTVLPLLADWENTQLVNLWSLVLSCLVLVCSWYRPGCGTAWKRRLEDKRWKT